MRRISTATPPCRGVIAPATPVPPPKGEKGENPPGLPASLSPRLPRWEPGRATAKTRAARPGPAGRLATCRARPRSSRRATSRPAGRSPRRLSRRWPQSPARRAGDSPGARAFTEAPPWARGLSETLESPLGAIRRVLQAHAKLVQPCAYRVAPAGSCVRRASRSRVSTQQVYEGVGVLALLARRVGQREAKH